MTTVTEKETWVALTSAPGYDVSSLGRVRSWRPCRGESLPRILKLGARDGNSGVFYYRVHIRLASGVFKVQPVHRLVAEAFLGPRPPGAHIRHLDGNSLNNEVSNLAYGTPSENVVDTIRHGTHCQASKTHCIHGHPFTPENTFLRPEGHRVCLACQRLRKPPRQRKQAKDSAPCPVCGAQRSRSKMARHIRDMHPTEVSS